MPFCNNPSDKISSLNIRWLLGSSHWKQKTTQLHQSWKKKVQVKIRISHKKTWKKNTSFFRDRSRGSLHRISHAINRNSKIIALRDGGPQEMWTMWIHHEMFHVKLFIIPYFVKLLYNDFFLHHLWQPLFLKTNLSLVLLFPSMTSMISTKKRKIIPFPYKVGPLLVIIGDITSISRVISPVSQL